MPRKQPEFLCSTIIFACLSAFCLVGCGQQDQITSYTVPKQHVLDEMNPGQPRSGTTDEVSEVQLVETRMLGAVVPQGEQTWFFKLTGPNKPVEDQMENFLRFVESIKFTAGRPKWGLPTGWVQAPASGMRFATVHVTTGDNAMEMSVIPLPSGDDESDEYLLSNLNRWRGQLQLAPISVTDLPDETLTIALAETKVTVINYLGSMKQGGGMGRAPFASGARPRPAGPSSLPPQRPQPTAPAQLTYKTPKDWQSQAVSGMRKAAFKIVEGDQQVETTVIDLAEAAGDLLPNINRWRGQVKLQPISQEELDRTLKRLPIGNSTGHYIELVGPESAKPRETILGVITIQAGKAWFVKLKGSAELAQREKKNFEAFVKSIKFDSAGGEK